VGISKTKRPYLGFRYRNQDWQFRAMPFGLNIAPRMFTKSNSSCGKNDGRGRNMVSTLLGRPSDYCINKGGVYKNVRTSNFYSGVIGMDPEQEKSRLVPAQVFEWLGVHFDLVSHTAQASSEKVTCFQQKLRSVITSRFCSKRVIMQLQGQCNWISRCDPVVRLMMSETKSILRYFRRQDLDSPLELDRERRLSLCRWVTDISIPQTLGAPAPDIIVQTDASLTGWGFLIDRIPFSGVFDPSMAYSINILELLTVWYSLLMIAEEGAVIHILSDSLVAVSIVRRGTSPVHHLSALADLIWRRAALFRWTLSISHIEGNFNVIADQLSRKEALSTEWSLQPKDFQKILDLNPNLEVDLFATSLNYQLGNYVSPCPDADAIAVDALTTQWDQWDHLYLYPPHLIDFEGFSEIDDYTIHQRSVSYSRDSNQTMVYGLETESDSLRVDGDSPTTDGGRQSGKSTTDYQTTRLDVIEAAYQRQFPGCNEAIALMAAPLRDNSVRDYQHKWQKLLNFLSDKQIPPDELSFANVFQFFTYLFYERNLKPSTVAHYRSALTVPLMLHYNIDLKVPAVTDLLRAMSLKRPNAPASTPGWSLNKVLTLLDNLSEPIPEQLLLWKTAFLLLMATGWRISELHACVRAEKYCSFTWESNLVIRPHPLFLAKNEICS
ncbi:unnamed protein product, partial [Meganyctiphanes norvegica]